MHKHTRTSCRLCDFDRNVNCVRSMLNSVNCLEISHTCTTSKIMLLFFHLIWFSHRIDSDWSQQYNITFFMLSLYFFPHHVNRTIIDRSHVQNGDNIFFIELYRFHSSLSLAVELPESSRKLQFKEIELNLVLYSMLLNAWIVISSNYIRCATQDFCNRNNKFLYILCINLQQIQLDLTNYISIFMNNSCNFNLTPFHIW